MEMQFQLQERFQLLDEKEMEAVRLFIERLLQKRHKAPTKARKKTSRKPDFQNLRQIAVPTNIIIDRDRIYAERTQFAGIC